MKSGEDEYICTENMLQLLEVALVDAQCSPTYIGQERMSPSSLSPSESPICGRVASDSVMKKNSADNQISQGTL